MKNKKILIISIVVTILVVACAVGGFLYYQNMKKEQEETDKKALQEEIAKFAGTYINIYSDGSIIYTLKADGTLILPDGTTVKPMSINKKQDGSIWVKTENSTSMADEKGYYLYPIGVGQRGNKNKLRLDYLSGFSVEECEKK